MRNILALTQRELSASFFSPVAYVIGFLFLLRPGCGSSSPRWSRARGIAPAVVRDHGAGAGVRDSGADHADDIRRIRDRNHRVAAHRPGDRRAGDRREVPGRADFLRGTGAVDGGLPVPDDALRQPGSRPGDLRIPRHVAARGAVHRGQHLHQRVHEASTRRGDAGGVDPRDLHRADGVPGRPDSARPAERVRHGQRARPLPRFRERHLRHRLAGVLRFDDGFLSVSRGQSAGVQTMAVRPKPSRRTTRLPSTMRCIQWARGGFTSAPMSS